MGNIVQMQRRTIEGLYRKLENGWPREVFEKEKPPFLFFVRNEILDPTNLRGIKLLEISEGIGTCSEIEGMNAAVFGYSTIPPNEGMACKPQSLANSACAILLWPQAVLIGNPDAPEEIRRIDPLCDKKSALELLEYDGFHHSKAEHGRMRWTSIYFRRTGHLGLYTPMK